MKEIKEILFNYPQWLYLLIKAKITVILWGRATGKTTGPVTSFIYDNIQSMPRSLGGWVVPTYEKVLSQMIPNLKAGLANLGLIEDVHYTIGKFFPEETKVKRPYKCPTKPTYFVHFCNGSGFVFISLDRASTMGNGLDLDWLLIDEAKMCPYDKVKEVMLTLRGNGQHFGHLSNHYSIMIASDKPTSSKGRWLFDYADQVNKEMIECIKDAAIYLEKLKTSYDNSTSEAHKRNLLSKIKKWTRDINELRKMAVNVSEASTLDNICNIGIETIEHFYKLLDPLDFEVSVLNKTVFGGKNMFYSLLDEDVHGYTSSNYEYLDTLPIGAAPEKDCRWDSDWDPKQPLDIGCDHNNAINWYITGQLVAGEYRQLKSDYVLKSENQFLRDMVDKFCKYWEHHPLKTVHYYYNHTSKPEDASGDETIRDKMIAQFKKNGWRVIEKYYGKEPGHFVKFNFFNDYFSGKDEKLKPFRYNIANNQTWYIGMKSAQSRQGQKGFEKDKSSERDPKVPPQFATHSTEASDCLHFGRWRGKIKRSRGEFSDTAVA